MEARGTGAPWLQVVVNHLIQMLGTELMSLGKTVRTLSCSAIFSAPLHYMFLRWDLSESGTHQTRLEWLASQLPGSSCLYHPGAEVIAVLGPAQL